MFTQVTSRWPHTPINLSRRLPVPRKWFPEVAWSGETKRTEFSECWAACPVTYQMLALYL